MGDTPMVELDVQLTRDHEVVVMHDWTLDRTTDGSGAVRDRTLAEIRRLDAGAWFGPAFRGERVPTLFARGPSSRPMPSPRAYGGRWRASVA